jgi:membrane protein implicated in regulation of membrane protease activity
MARLGYALFFAVMAGGVAAGIAGVVLGALLDDPSWARIASGLLGLAVATLTVRVLRRTEAR